MRHVVALLCGFIGVFNLNAQDLSSFASFKDLEKKTKSTQLTLPEAPEIEHPVDANEYILGPGDVLSILVGGNTEEEQQLMVTPEGTLVFPSIGGLEVAGLTLQKVREKIGETIQAHYRNQEIFISLIQLRTFRVTVSGAVNFPGLVGVNGLDRVSDAIFMAGGLKALPTPFLETENPREKQRGVMKPNPEDEITEAEFEKLQEEVASKRNIIIKRRNGAIFVADLLKFEAAGDLAANPYLVDGDVIIVPTVQKEVGEISISGAVRSPIIMEYSKGDRVFDLLNIAHWFSIDADSSKIYIARFMDNTSRAEEILLELDWSDSLRVDQLLQTPLQADDRVFVRTVPKFHKKQTVEIQGEVVYPGEYALLESPTRLSTIIKTAGGFTNQAALNAAYVVRRAYENKYKDPEYDRLDLILVQDMDRKEKSFYRERSREIKGLISTDFTALFERGEQVYDVVLNDQDLIVIPAKDYAVNIIGHVKNPGLMPYVPQQTADYYIEKAGGYSKNAWRGNVRVQKAGSSEILSIKETEVEMGDVIIIPEKIERTNTVRDIMMITVQLATVVMLLVQTRAYYSTK